MVPRRWWTVALALALIAAGALAALAAADITGKWTASFDTQIGKQDYTYDFVVKDGKLTGHMKSNIGESDVLDVRVALAVPGLGGDVASGERGEGDRADELRRGARHHDRHVVAALHELAAEIGALVGGDRAAHPEDDAAA